MLDLASLSNDELFKLCKSTGIPAGPITPSTRSVYEKKLLRVLNDSSKPVTESPVVILKANLQAKETQPLVAESEKSTFMKPITPIRLPVPEIVIEKPTPKQISQPEAQVFIEKPARRSIVKTSSEERTSYEMSNPIEARDTQPTIIQSSSTSRIYREEIFNGISDRPSPQRQQQKKTESPKRVIQPEFRLLKQQQPSEQYENKNNNSYNIRNETVAQASTSKSASTGPNIRKRTATVESPYDLSDRTANAMVNEEVNVEKKDGGFFSFKKILLVLVVTLILYFLMMHLQSNPENPINKIE